LPKNWHKGGKMLANNQNYQIGGKKSSHELFLTIFGAKGILGRFKKQLDHKTKPQQACPTFVLGVQIHNFV
jgi:hypothetical protein